MTPSRSTENFVDPLSEIDTKSADVVVDIFEDATEANFDASCRQGSADVIEPMGRLLATGDLHDNPLNFARVVGFADLANSSDDAPRHVTLHEVIHSDRLLNDMDFSYRALLRVAALKRDHPELVHTLLANHELSQIVGAGIVKDGVRVVDAFNEAIDFTFGDDAHLVNHAIGDFIRSMPLALICRSGVGSGVLCAHSLPSPHMMKIFDPGVLERELIRDDYEPRKGSAHLMVWGRKHTDTEQLEELARRWDVSLFLLGHEHAENGWALVPPNALVLNSDHERGVVLPVDLASPPSASDAAWQVQSLTSTE